MSDFCWQCVEEMGINGEKNDFKDICQPGDMILVICEGCGSTLVNHEGRCVGICDRVNHVDLSGCLRVMDAVEV